MRSRLILPLLFLTACGELKTPTTPGGGGEPIDQTATLTRVQTEVFTPSCATLGCHDPIGQQGQVVLSAGRSYASVVGVPSTQTPQLQRVAPGDPDNSYLYRKLTGAGIVGERMPLQMPPLSAEKLKLVRDWIRRGAPND
jgi:hypothetical protein